jgi:uncharacterized caspase-like protein
MRALLNLALATVLVLLACAPALADKRIALVIGNSAYQKVASLAGPADDAMAVAHMLKSAGFDSVETMLDGTDAEMTKALKAFRVKSRDSDVAVVYYAGHAAQLDGTNYLIPVDATLAREKNVRDEALSLDDVMYAIQSAAKLGLVLLDACREYPFYKSTKALSWSGLARVEPPANVLISFAAKAESIAVNDSSRNSPYTRALLDHLASPGVDIRLAFDRIRDDVMQATANAQQPSMFGYLQGEVHLIARK